MFFTVISPKDVLIETESRKQEEMTSSDISACSSSCLISACDRGCLFIFPRNMMFTELSLRYLLSGHRNCPMYQVSFSTVFFFVNYMRIHVTYWPRLFFVVFREMHNLTMTTYVRRVPQLYVSTKFHVCQCCS